MSIFCQDDNASLVDDQTMVARNRTCYDDSGNVVGTKSTHAVADGTYADGSEQSVLSWEQNKGTWLDDDGKEHTGFQWEAAVAKFDKLLSGDPDSKDVGSYYGVDGSALKVEGEVSSSEDGHSASAQTTLAELGYYQGTTGTNKDEYRHLAFSSGDGGAGESMTAIATRTAIRRSASASTSGRSAWM